MSDPVANLDALRASPEPQFIERDTAALKAALVSKFEAISGRTLYPSQVENYIINLMAYALSNLGGGIQAGLLQNRAVWAEDGHLDQLGANVGTIRLDAQHARALVEFSLSEPRASSVVVPLGTRVAAGGSLVFATEVELVIPAGEMSGSVDVVAAVSGASHNELVPGQIQDILDPVAYVSAVANVQTSAGGSDIETDDRFRERIVGAFERITRGGSRRGYQELVKAAHPDIVDVAVMRPEPGHIDIYPLTLGGVAPDAIDDVVAEHLDPETVIPMGDFVTIKKAEPVVFDVAMTIKMAPGYANGAEQKLGAIVAGVFAGWSQIFGVQISPSALIEAVRKLPGVVGVEGPEFEFTDLGPTQFAMLGAVAVAVEVTPNV